MKLLFICNVNKFRSPTAEEIFKDRYETKSAGLSEFATKRLTKEMLEWADIVFVMESKMRKKIGKRFPEQYLKKRIVMLDIEDIYDYMQPELCRILEARVNALVN